MGSEQPTIGCDLCIHFYELAVATPIGSGGEFAPQVVHLFKDAHHHRWFLADRNRFEEFQRLVDMRIPDPDVRTIFVRMAEPLLSRKINKRPRLRDLKRADRKPQNSRIGTITRDEESSKLAEFAQGYCLCGCETKLTSVRRVFARGHDARFYGWLRRIERGLLDPRSSEISQSARDVMGALPRCKCCGGPIMKGEYGPYCAAGTCLCREKEEAVRAKKALIKNRT